METFISHSNEDVAIYTALCKALDADGIQRWNPSDMNCAGLLAAQLRDAISKCDVCVFVATRSSIKSNWCLAEIGAFWGAGKDVFIFMGEAGLGDEAIPSQFRGRLFATDVNYLMRDLRSARDRLSAEAAAVEHLGQRPADLFWLGHDLARAIRLFMSDADNRSDINREIRQAIHHLDKIGFSVPASERILLTAVKRLRNPSPFSGEEKEAFVSTLADAKNQIGQSLQSLQPGFLGYPTIEESRGVDDRVEEV